MLSRREWIGLAAAGALLATALAPAGWRARFGGDDAGPSEFGPAELDPPGLAVALIDESAAGELRLLAQSEAFRAAVRAQGGEFRLLEEDHPPELDAAHWLAAYQLERDAVPWIVVSHGAKRRGYRGPPPRDESGELDVDAVVALIARVCE